MQNPLKHTWRAAALGVAIFLAGCVVTTEKPFFNEADFSMPKVLSGDWASVPDKPGDEVLKVRMTEHGKMWRAVPLTLEGAVDKDEDPVDFGVVEISPGEYILVQADNPGGPINYLGLKADEGKLTFYLFAGGESDGGKGKFNALVTSLGMTHDASFTYEARVAGDITDEKLKKLFRELLAAPESFDGHPSVYTRVAH